MQPRSLCACAFALLALGFAVLEDGAEGYVAQGRPWPGGVIRYYNAAGDQAWAVRRAADAWNKSGAKVRFVAVPALLADVRIEHFPRASCTVNAGATIGYAPSSRVWVFRRDESSPYCNSYTAALAIAHELGHVLGLGHETRGCSLMNPEGTLQGPSLCPKAKPWQWRCRLLTRDDVAGAIALYGGTARPERGPRDCDLYAGMQAPTDLTVSATGAAHEFRISFRRPPLVTVPALLAGHSTQPDSFATAAVVNRCSTSAYRALRHPWHAQQGQVEQTFMYLPSGTYCLSVWAVDAFSRPSPRPAVLWVHVV